MTKKYQTELMLFVKTDLIESIENLKSELEYNENYNNYKILEIIYDAFESMGLGIDSILREEAEAEAKELERVFG